MTTTREAFEAAPGKIWQIPDVPNDSIEFSASADDIDEAVQFAVATLQQMTIDRHAKGFTAPVLVGESFELIDGEWTRVFRFSAEFLPAVS